MRRFTPAIVLILLAALLAGGAVYLRDPLYYPWVVTEARVVPTSQQIEARTVEPGQLKMTIFGNGMPSSEKCESLVVALTENLKVSCPSCAVRERRCLNPPSAAQRSLLSSEPLKQPVSIHAAGVVVYESLAKGLAEATCMESERAAAGAFRLRCIPADKPKPASQLDRDLGSLPLLALLISAIGMFGAWFTCFLLVRYERLHASFSLDYANSGPQKFHSFPTPRIGGVAILFSLMLIGLMLQSIEHRYGTREYGWLVVAAMPAFAIGLAEDVTKKVGVLPRLLITAAAALIGAYLLNAILGRLDIPGIDQVLQWVPLAVLFTAFAVAGVANAFNLIDGYNGLAGGIVVLAAAALGFVSWKLGDPLVMTSSFALAGAMMGFLAWNWPQGRIFLGDGGAYLAGFWLALLSVLLVSRNEEVSPWFPLVVLIYPIVETIYSITRRRLSGKSPGEPDASHLHQLVHALLIRRRRVTEISLSVDAGAASLNGAVAKYFWLSSALVGCLAVLVYDKSGALALLALAYVVTYLWTYHRLAVSSPQP